jgi:hypothetical protein
MTTTYDSYQEFTEAELRQHINQLIEFDPKAAAALKTLAAELGIKLKPAKVEFAGPIYWYGPHAIILDYEDGHSIPMPEIIECQIPLGTRVKVTIEEVE